MILLLNQISAKMKQNPAKDLQKEKYGMIIQYHMPGIY